MPAGVGVFLVAGVAELADAQDSGSCDHYGRGGSIPLTRTYYQRTYGDLP